MNIKYHPGIFLFGAYMKPNKLTVYAVAKAAGIPASRLHEITKGRRRITPDTAMRLGAVFGRTYFPAMLLTIQSGWDVAMARKKRGQEYAKIKPLKL